MKQIWRSVVLGLAAMFHLWGETLCDLVDDDRPEGARHGGR